VHRSAGNVATVRDARAESPTARTLVLDVPAWPGHRAGHHDASTASAVAPLLGGNLAVPGGIGAVDAGLIGTFVLYHAPLGGRDGRFRRLPHSLARASGGRRQRCVHPAAADLSAKTRTRRYLHAAGRATQTDRVAPRSALAGLDRGAIGWVE
jgi:hypothetical protein